MDDMTKEALISVVREMDEFVGAEVDPGLDRLDEWRGRLEELLPSSKPHVGGGPKCKCQPVGSKTNPECPSCWA